MSPTSKEMQTRNAINKKHSVVERSQWGLKIPKVSQLVSDWDFDSIVLHHSGNSGEKDPRAIEAKHIQDRGWDDVGYHYLIHPNGTIYEGRKIYHKGSHVSGANTGKIGILLMGDFNEQWWDFDDTLSNSHISAANRLTKTLRGHFTKVRKLGGHKEYLPGMGYTCPGNLIMDKLNRMRNKHGLNKP
ncbi:N-acetylmuramoyl-L-alanine amidase [Microbulbifer aggregans]|uniref:N-acetylmuramoyl-L-alanine amidase n=1 Tax=Microbulbifer aggregans TaxID=1769779 RepID=UPI001CFDB2D3|nr:N-acetylmuramoyl-L-alanine amidase [Microbulbifer aggregans]